MSTDLTRVGMAVHPATGELLDLATADDERLAQERYDLIELRHRLDEYGAQLDEELAARLDRDNARTLWTGAFKVTVPAPDVTEWDVAQLSLELEALVQDGRLSRAAAQNAVETIVTYKANARELKKLAKHADPEVRRAINACGRERPNMRRRATVTPTRPGGQP